MRSTGEEIPHELPRRDLALDRLNEPAKVAEKHAAEGVIS
jgi:hypothetical protein